MFIIKIALAYFSIGLLVSIAINLLLFSSNRHLLSGSETLATTIFWPTVILKMIDEKL